MDDISKAKFNEVWSNFRYDPTSDDFKGLLDILYEKGVLETEYLIYLNSNSYADLTDLGAYVYTHILNHIHGYQHFLKGLETCYNWFFLESIKLHSDDNRLREELFQDALILGDVPAYPSNYIVRTQLLNEIQNYLKSGNGLNIKIVLHGMNGSGKSSLAAAVVKNRNLISEYFNNKVFWVYVGKIDSIELLNIMYRLYLKIINSDNDLKKQDLCLKKPDFDTIQENLNIMRDKLIILFRKDSYKKSLLILDNMYSNQTDNVFDNFNVGCNILVTTQEKDIVPMSNNIHFIAVADGFTEEESLKCFAKSLDSDFQILGKLDGPISLHNSCRGDPMMISLLASTLHTSKERILLNPQDWKVYINLYKNLKNFDIVKKRSATIDLCCNNLDKDLKAKYEDLAIFVDDINIMPKMLKTLWSIDEIHDVEAIMTKLQNKSLIVSKFNKNLNSYIYGIHHVLLNYLKENLTQNQLILKHKQLIEAYQRVSHNNYAKLVDDNYIFQYIGYHLSEAKMFDEFKLYFDLNFIGAKIKATGIADLIRDFKVYEDYITKKDVTLKEKLEKYRLFVESYGEDLHNYKDSDIVQTGLKLSKDHPIYKEALQIAKARTDNVYFQMHAPHKSNYFTHTLSLSNGINAACFTKITSEILVGTDTGVIQLWEQTYNTNLKEFNGHKKAIISLVLNKDTNEFLSVSEDETVKLWNLNNFQTIHNSNSNGLVYDDKGYNQLIPSPRLKQQGHQTFFGSDMGIDRSKTFQLKNDALISAAFSNDYHENKYIVTGSKSGKVIVWCNLGESIKKVIEIAIKPDGQSANCVAFSDDDRLVIATCDHSILLYDVISGSFVSKFLNKHAINALHVVLTASDDVFDSLIARHSSSLTMWRWKQSGAIDGPVVIESIEQNELSATSAQNEFVCSTITETRLIVGSSDSSIKMWDIDTRELVDKFFNNNAKVVCLDASCDDDGTNNLHILLSGFDDKTVKMWHISPNQEDTTRRIKNLPIFATSWQHNSQIPLIAIANTDDKIEVLKKHNALAETPKIRTPIKAITFSICGNMIYYGLENGSVHEFIIKTKCDKRIMELEDSVTLLKCFQSPSINGNCNGYNGFLENDILVAFSETGTFFIFHKGVATAKLIVKFKESNSKFQLNTSKPIKDCFFLKSINKLITIGLNRSIKLWSLDQESNDNFKGSGEFLDREYLPKGDCRVLFGEKLKVNMVVMSLDQMLLGIVMDDGSFEIFMFDYSNFDVVMQRTQGIKFNNITSLICCCFSFDKRYFAMGADNGNILIWNILINKLHVNLQLHRTIVRNLVFSPSEHILVSIGEEITWWDLKHIPADLLPRNSTRRRSNSIRKSLTIETLSLNTSQDFMNLTLWNNKKGTILKPHLLSTIKLHGSYADNITSSQDFTSFLTVDNQGEIYNMEILDHS